MTFPMFTVDAFTTGENEAFSGNAAEVFLLEFDDDIADGMKQKIAMEMNLSITAFVAEGWTRGQTKLENSKPNGPIRRTIRWFTPTTEIPLCGHGTFASSKILFANSEIIKTENNIEFHSKFGGTLQATIDRKTQFISLNLPLNSPVKLGMDNNDWIQDILCATLGEVLLVEQCVHDFQYSSSGTKILLIRLKDELQEKGLLQMAPNFQKMLEVDTNSVVHNVIVTVKGDGVEGPHFYSRFFSPWIGINEDSGTGSAHAVLTPYWKREYSHVETLIAKQSSKRGAYLRCLLEADRVRISGQARITVRGEFLPNE